MSERPTLGRSTVDSLVVLLHIIDLLLVLSSLVLGIALVVLGRLLLSLLEGLESRHVKFVEVVSLEGLKVTVHHAHTTKRLPRKFVSIDVPSIHPVVSAATNLEDLHQNHLVGCAQVDLVTRANHASNLFDYIITLEDIMCS